MSNLEEQPQRKRRSSQAKKEPETRQTSQQSAKGQSVTNQSASYEAMPTKPDVINPEWRSVLKNKRKNRRTTGSLSSPQELQLWLQQGGWRYIAAGALLLVFALIVILSLNENTKANSTRMAPLTSVPSTNGTILLPTVTPIPTPSAPPPQLFVVAGTGQMGLLLRAEPSTNGPVLETLRDGMQVEQVEADFTGPSFVWRKIRSPSGKEGWVAVDWLQPVP